jgi:hypothetical protein
MCRPGATRFSTHPRGWKRQVGPGLLVRFYPVGVAGSAALMWVWCRVFYLCVVLGDSFGPTAGRARATQSGQDGERQSQASMSGVARAHTKKDATGTPTPHATLVHQTGIRSG